LCLSFLAAYLFFHNLKYEDILRDNTYGIANYKPVLSLYQEQAENLPLFCRAYDYSMDQYVNYTNVTKALGDKFIVPHLHLLHNDSFYAAADYPELKEGYLSSVVAKESIKDYVAKRNGAGNVIFMSVMDEAAQNLPGELVQYLKPLGSQLGTLSYRGSYAGVLHEGKVLDKVDNAGAVTLTSEQHKDFLPAQLDYQVHSAGQPFGSTSTIRIKGFDYSPKGRGINIVVYSLHEKRVTDIITYDTNVGSDANGGIKRVAFVISKK
jgi:hypothetical protein